MIGDGTSGSRVQPVYAVASDVTDRYASIAPLISHWAGEMDSAVDQSAAETGGERHIRFEMNADCSLKILHVTLSPSGDDTFSNTITELRNQGYTATDRKYVIWTDANIYCGFQSGTIVYGETEWYDHTFVLGGSISPWMMDGGGAADCTATLFYWAFHPTQVFNSLATTSFSAAA